MMNRFLFYILLLCISLSSLKLIAQVNWQPLESIDSIYEQNQKPYLIYIYTDWCKVCKMQSQGVFSDTSLSALMNQNLNSFRLNAESTKPLKILGREYRGSKNSSYHEFVSLSASAGNEVSFPTLMIFSPKMNLIYRKSGLVTKNEIHQIIQELK